MKFRVLTVALLTTLLSPAMAAIKTVTLSVPTMNCPVCPITIKKALTRVPGVDDVDVSYEKREARVTFDDQRASVDRLMKATADAGYPSTLATAK